MKMDMHLEFAMRCLLQNRSVFVRYEIMLLVSDWKVVPSNVRCLTFTRSTSRHTQLHTQPHPSLHGSSIFAMCASLLVTLRR